MVSDKTMNYNAEVEKAAKIIESKETLKEVYSALMENGYNPINLLVGYILSGDPTYITNHKNARTKIAKIERDELLEQMIKKYLEID